MKSLKVRELVGHIEQITSVVSNGVSEAAFFVPKKTAIGAGRAQYHHIMTTKSNSIAAIAMISFVSQSPNTSVLRL